MGAAEAEGVRHFREVEVRQLAIEEKYIQDAGVFMRHKRRWFISVIGLCVAFVCCGFVYLVLFSFPPTEWITRNYFEAVIAGDLDEATKFTSDSTRYPPCTEATIESALEDIREFGGAEVRNVEIEVVGSGGSDDTIQVGRVRFEYKKSGETTWHTGYTQVLTAYDSFGFRYMCGKYP